MTCLWAQSVWVITFKVTNLSEAIALKEFRKWANAQSKCDESVFLQTYTSVKKAAFNAVCGCYLSSDYPS